MNKAAGKDEPVTQEIAISVKGDKVECSINNKVVASYDKASAGYRRQTQINRRRLWPPLRAQHRSVCDGIEDDEALGISLYAPNFSWRRRVAKAHGSKTDFRVNLTVRRWRECPLASQWALM